MNKVFLRIIKKNKFITMLSIVMGILASIAITNASRSIEILFNVIDEKSGIVDNPIPITINNTLYVLGLYLIGIILLYISMVVASKYVYRVSNDLRTEIANKIINEPYSNFDHKNSGNYISWFTNDVNQLVKLSFEGLLDMVQHFGIIVSSFYFLTSLNVYFGFIALGFLLLTIIIPQLFNPLLLRAQKKLTLEDEKFTEDIREVVGGFNLFYTSNKIAKFKELLSISSRKREDVNYSYNKTLALTHNINTFVSLIAQVGLTITTVFFVVKGQASIGAPFAVASLAGLMFGSVGAMINKVMSFRSAKAIYEKFDFEEPKNHSKDLGELEQISMKHVSFKYNERMILSDFTMDFDPSKKYAIIGASGSGKSTIIKLLLGVLSPTEGVVNLNNHNIKEVNYRDYYEQISYIDQNIYLFKGTIRDNITLWKDVDDEKLNLAIEKSNLTEFIQMQENGLDTVLTESGKNISGGEKQRIALARAFINQPKLLLVDETTSQLDAKNAMEIEKMMLEQNDFGVIMVSHHFNEEVLNDFDEVIDLSNIR